MTAFRVRLSTPALIGIVSCFLLHTMPLGRSPASGQETAADANPTTDRWHLSQPFWDSPIVHGESVLFVRESENSHPTAGLLLTPDRVIHVRRADRSIDFEEGRDFVVDREQRRLVLTAESRIPSLAAEELFPAVGEARAINHRTDDPSRGVLFDNQHWFHDQQVEVTYQSDERWTGYRPEIATHSLSKTLAKLRAGEPVRIAVTGDSITFGLNASQSTGVAPEMPIYPELVAEHLRIRYASEIHLVNNAVGGWRLEQGLQQLDPLLESKPDLMIIAFGMNHFGSRDVERFRRLQTEMLQRITAADSDIEIILVSSMHGNPEWVHTPADQFEPHRDVLASLTGDQIALADLTTMWGQMLERKRVVDLTGNGVNHPNDFGHRVYASTILGLLTEPFNTEKSTDNPMSAAETVRTAKLPPGFELSVFAEEPDVQNPIAITLDERGRLWVAENYTWAGASLGQFRTDLNDRIVILSDTDGDGTHDQRTVFWDGAKKLTSVEVGFGGVWALTPPQLLFIPDADRDDVPDGPPIVVLDGFDDHDVSHNVANGLRWGPDGWLYGRHGIMATSGIGKPGDAQSQRIQINTGVWRYHPTRQVVEEVMHGMTNSWGFDYDRHGEMFCINTVIGHLWHAVPGARTERMYGVDRNPHAYQLIPQVADHVHWDTGEKWNDIHKGISDTTLAAGGGHAHIGLMIYQGDNWPQRYHNQLFTLNMHGQRINCDRLERQDSHFVAKHEPDLAFFADPFFRGMDMVIGPDGGVLIADWSDTGECHDHDGVHRSSGRIYKLTYGQPDPVAEVDLATASDTQLLDALAAPNVWWPRQALRILQQRAAAAAGGSPIAEVTTDSTAAADKTVPTADLRRLLRIRLDGADDTATRLRAAWALNLLGDLDPATLLASPDEPLRVWGVRLLADALTPQNRVAAAAIAGRFTELASDDPSGLVALYVASAMQRLPHELRWPIATALAGRDELADDQTFAIMVWLGIEPAIPHDPTAATRLARASRLPLVTQNIARRLAVEIESDGEPIDRLLAEVVATELKHPEEVITGIGLAFKGWQSAPAPSGWSKVAARFAESESADIRQTVQQLNVVFGDGRAIDDLRQLAADGAADPEARRQALRAILQRRPEGLAALLQSLAGDRAVMVEALRGLALYDDPSTPQRVLGLLRIYSPEARAEMINTLASRPSYAAALLTAVRDGKLSAAEVSAFHARQIRGFDDPELTAGLIEVWGDVRATDAEKVIMIGKLKADLDESRLAAADRSAGRAIFQQSCANCHVLFGQGANVGPDLTGSNRKQLDYLLENIIDPSASVGAEFRTTLFSLDDGRVLSGVIRQQSERTITIRTAQDDVTIERSRIEATKPTNASLMPEGLLQNLSADQIRDLVAYLQAPGQVPLP